MARVFGSIVVSLLALLVTPIFAEEGAKSSQPRNIILIGWDGAQRAHLMECLERGELPNLQRLAKEGALVNIDVVTGATDTKAGWTQILTGYNPEVTGVFSNGRYRDVPKGLSVFERLKEHFGPDFVCVAVIGKREHCGEIREPFKRQLTEEEAAKLQAEQKQARQAQAKQQGQQPAQAGQRRAQRGAGQAAQPGAGRQVLGRVVEENGVKYLVFEGSPYYTMHKACDVWEYGLMEDEKVGSRALELLEKYRDKPFFFFVHFASVDHQGHRFGENSKEYNDALISNDTWLGRIVEKLKELGVYDKTLIYVTADHGFNEGGTGHSYAPYVFLATNDPLVKRDGMRQDIAPTILARFGLDLTKLQPPLDGEPLTRPATKPVLKAPETPPARQAGQARAGQGGQRRARQGQGAPAVQAP